MNEAATNAGHGPTVIGWREWVGLPDWGIKRLRAKADTGARTGAIDVESIEELPGDRVRFSIAMSRRDREKLITIEADVTRRGAVRSAHGVNQDRLFVATTITLAGVTKAIELSLSRRHHLRHRLLLGRAALGGAFLVDPSRAFAATPRHPPRRARSHQPPDPTRGVA